VTAVNLSPAAVEAIAQRVVELLAGDSPRSSEGLVTAAEVARRFGVSRDYVYDHAANLGAVRMGDGPKARLRFDPQLVAERLGAEKAPAGKPRPRPRRRPSAAPVDLLPIRGRS
jgi:hypothetical protein